MKAIRNVLFSLALLSAVPALASDTVNINTADAETLSSALNGVGLARAQAVVEYRKAHGPFQSVDELVAVKGIGDKTLEQNRERLRVK